MTVRLLRVTILCLHPSRRPGLTRARMMVPYVPLSFPSTDEGFLVLGSSRFSPRTSMLAQTARIPRSLEPEPDPGGTGLPQTPGARTGRPGTARPRDSFPSCPSESAWATLDVSSEMAAQVGHGGASSAG